MRSLILLLLVFLLPAPVFGAEVNEDQQVEELTRQKNQAMERVKAIVNQPITHVPRNEWARPALFNPGWFHKGAKMPHFDTVDIRATQDTSGYSRFEYVSSDLNPGVMFLGSELEFNAMTKMFYTDRNLPKKKLTEAEMVEINRLYRIIGASLAKLAVLENPWRISYLTSNRFLSSPYGVLLQLGLLALVSAGAYRVFFTRRG